jgi:hypothetical protein
MHWLLQQVMTGVAALPACLPAFLSWRRFVFRSNVLLDENLRAFVADLGVAQALGSKARTAVGGTRLYAGACLPPATATAGVFEDVETAASC